MKSKKKIITHPSGAGSSHQSLRHDLIPRELKDLLARRYTLGEATYGAYAYRKGLRDRAFIVDRIGHLHEHLNKLFQPCADDGDSFADNLGAVGWALGFLAEVWADPQGRSILESMMRAQPDG
jgi:hypothetical protein